MKSHLSAVHTGLETSYTPAVPLFRPPPTPPCLYFTPNVNGSFLDKKKKGKEKRKEKGIQGETRKQLQEGRVLLGLGVQSEQQLRQAVSHSRSQG